MSASSPSAEHILVLLELRVAVAFLGEQGQKGWWKTQFLQPTGQRFLEFIYPRTAFAAAVNATTEVAKNFHDERIGKGGAFHLFRLPFIWEQRMRALLLAGRDQSWSLIVAGEEAAMHALSEFAEGSPTAPDGPVRIGNNKALLSGVALPKLAAFYFDAFKRRKQTLPYFTAEEG